MGSLIYIANCSLDGYTADETGNFDWTEPTEELHAFVNDLVRSNGTHLYGRRMYETMAVWETDPSLAEQSPVMADFARLWQAADKVVYSRTLNEVWTARTSLERDFEPQAVRDLKAQASQDILVAGAELAAAAFRAGLVDECGLILLPWLIGGGKRGLPEGVRAPLELIDQRTFSSGAVYVRYRLENAEGGSP
jgi:dihydrofolate reductase